MVELPAETSTPGVVFRKIDERDVLAEVLYPGQLRGRTLPVAAATLANQLIIEMESRFACNEKVL